MAHWCRAFGLRIASSVDLAGVPCEEGGPDLVVESRPAAAARQEVDAMLSGNACWRVGVRADENVAGIPGIARFRARGGSEVLIEHDPGLPATDLRALTVNTALPLVLQQRDGIVLEASAIRWLGKTLLLAGQGPCGKSSLAALMADAGAELLADSHCMIRMTPAGALAMDPALPHVRLWPPQIEELADSWPAPGRVREGLEKYAFVAPEKFGKKSVSIDGMLLLRRGIDAVFHIRRLRLPETLQALALCSDRLYGRPKSTAPGARFPLMARLAGLPVCHLLQWPRGAARVADTRDRLIELLADRATPTGG